MQTHDDEVVLVGPVSVRPPGQAEPGELPEGTVGREVSRGHVEFPDYGLPPVPVDPANYRPRTERDRRESLAKEVLDA